MSQYLEFAGNHPLLMAALVLVIAVLVMNEFRRKLLGFKELSVNEAVRLINHDDALALDVRDSRSITAARLVSVSQI